ncbi:MAG: deoxyribose-phosphate aldolase [Mycoplasmataceae bacterium]|nr:deoxyribose-phosphate aldolase [Mycoplasmataceae bacterium]
MELNKYIDHTILKRNSTKKDIDEAVQDAIKYQMKTLCIHPMWITYVKERLHKNGVDVTTVLGFPYGTQTTQSKICEAKDALKKGADELDFVINVSMIKSNDWDYVENELELIRKKTKGHVIKIILEIALLTDDEIAKASRIASDLGWDFVKTSTGIGVTGATIKAVKIMKENINSNTQIKAAGGVRTFAQAKEYIDAGVTRIGTSNGADIMQGKKGTNDY